MNPLTQHERREARRLYQRFMEETSKGELNPQTEESILKLFPRLLATIDYLSKPRL